MLDALAFLPLNDIIEGMKHIRQNIPTGNRLRRVKRSTQQLQSQLLSLCVARRDNKKTAVEVLEGLGYNH